MTQHQRFPATGPTYFFTVRLERTGATALTDHVDALRYAYARAVQDYPVTCHAMVVLPDHLHAIWTEPEGGAWYAERWRQIKTRFAHAVTPQKVGGLWQRRFQEHAIRTEDEFRRAVDHCRFNPVRHGLVREPDLWPYSSFAKAKAAA